MLIVYVNKCLLRYYLGLYGIDQASVVESISSRGQRPE